MKSISPKSWIFILAVGLVALGFWEIFQAAKSTVSPPLPTVQVVRENIIPPGIVVTEATSEIVSSAVTQSAAGDRQLGAYGNPALPAKNDLQLLAHSISNFLLIEKQATDRPLSANQEWSSTLRGKRPGHQAWFSENSPALDSKHQLIDRWHTPLFFHALGGQQWEIRSAGPDQKLWTEDDLTERTSGPVISGFR